MITKPILLDETGKEMVDALNKQNALIQVLAKDAIKTLPGSWEDVRRLVHSGYAAEIFDIGDQFVDTWTDVAAATDYTYPWHVNCFRQAELAGGETINVMLIQAQYAHPFGIQFSQNRAFLACPEGLAAGTYYFTFEKSWGANVHAGDVVCFTLTQEVPAGGRLSGCYKAPDLDKSTWRIYSHSADGKEVIETTVPTFEAAGTNLGVMPYAVRSGNLNSEQEMICGWSRWKTSALRQYLNSAAGVGEWWTPQDEWDIAPDHLASKAGFLSGLPEELLAAIKPVKAVTYTSAVQDAGEADITYDKVFLPSLEEMYFAPQVAGEGTAHEYWKRAVESAEPMGTGTDNVYPEMIHYAVENCTSAQTVRLRSTSRSSACTTWSINSTGYAYSIAAAHARRFAPVLAIG